MTDATLLSNLGEEYLRMVSQLPVSEEFKAFHTQPQHDGSAHIEEVGGMFEYVVTERGLEYERIGDLSADDVLYLLMEEVTQGIAMQYGFEHKGAGVDGRAVYLLYQEKLMGQFNPEWETKLREHHAKVLEKHPYTP